MGTFESLLSRIRGEFLEMPGPTAPQASRLWHLDDRTCENVLQTLLGQGFLTRTADGAFVAIEAALRPAKA